MLGAGDGTLYLYKYHYPANRMLKDTDGIPMGVTGKVELLNDKVMAQQPIVSLDWNVDKMGLACLCALDQTVKVIVCTKLNLY